MIDSIDSNSLRPCYNTFSKEQQYIIKVYKPLDYIKFLIYKNRQNKVKQIFNFNINREELDIHNKQDMIYNFVYTNLKRLDIVKSIEEFKSDSEEEDYVIDIEYY